MKNITLIFLILLGLAGADLYAADYRVEPPSSSVIFRVKHMGLALVRGEFKKFEGVLSFKDGQLARFEGRLVTDDAAR